MKNRLLIAVGVLLVITVVAVAKFRASEADMSSAAATAKAPDLSKALPKVATSDIDGMTFQSEANGETSLALKDGTWRVVSPVNAEADQDAAMSAAERLGDIVAVRVVSENEANHERLGVTTRKGVSVTAKKGSTVLSKLVIGNFGAGGTMVRKSDDKTVYAVDASLSYLFNKPLASWRNREITNVKPEDATDVVWKGPNPFHFVRNEKKLWEPAKGQKPIKNFNNGKVDSVISGLCRLRATDFAQGGLTAEGAGITDKSPSATVTAAGKTFTVRLGTKEQGGGTGFYATVDDKPTVYVITDFLSKRISPTADLFTQEPPKPGDAVPVQGGAENIPPTAPGGQQIPPDVLEKLKAQMAQRQQ